MGAKSRRHVLLIGLEVKHEALYARYREVMTPILHSHGGVFGYDFLVSRVLQAESSGAINRVFTLVFPDAATAERFFANTEYRAVRTQYFEPAVGQVTRIAAFDEAG